MKQKQQALDRVGDNLYRSRTSRIYYALFKVSGKQIRSSLRTTDRELARRRLEEHRHHIERLSVAASRTIPFAEYNARGQLVGGVAYEWLKIASSSIEPSTKDRYTDNIRKLSQYFGKLSVRNITLRHVQAWAATRKCAPASFNKERDVLVRVLNYAVDHGLVLNNPAEKLKRRRKHTKALRIPTKEQFCKLVTNMRSVIRRGTANQSADLIELLAYSGCRKSEIVGDNKYNKAPMTWGDINFEMDVFTVTQSKNHEPRTVPLFPPMRRFLLDLKARLPYEPKATDPIIPIKSAKKAVESACERLGFPQYGHHTCRHFFCSNAIEMAIDFKTIAGWLGHKDGGVLVARTYGHLRDEHSALMAKRMTYDANVLQNRPNNVVPIQTASTG